VCAATLDGTKIREERMRELTLHEEPAEAVLAPIASGLRRYNDAQAGASGRRVLAVTASGGDGDAVIGGVHGRVEWGWLYVERLWVSEEHRGGGLGGALLDALEAAAVERGARRAVLLTASWQAPGFYRKRGYTEAARFPLEIPAGGAATEFLMVKELV
jgi:ribosomal protein S18 acetylase RimI-like enzyme